MNNNDKIIHKQSGSSSAKKIRRVLVEIAENHLESVENKKFISEPGLEKLRSRLV